MQKLEPPGKVIGHTMFLFGACPKCIAGELAIVHRDSHYIATCLDCGNVCELLSVYPVPACRRKLVQGTRAPS